MSKVSIALHRFARTHFPDDGTTCVATSSFGVICDCCWF
jgi:hypothetical protein